MSNTTNEPTRDLIVELVTGWEEAEEECTFCNHLRDRYCKHCHGLRYTVKRTPIKTRFIEGKFRFRWWLQRGYPDGTFLYSEQKRLTWQEARAAIRDAHRLAGPESRFEIHGVYEREDGKRYWRLAHSENGGYTA